MDSYAGGKSGAGVYQTIISEIPLHRVFVSGCLGHCGVMRRIRRAEYSIGIDPDPSVIEWWQQRYPGYPTRLVHGDVFVWLTWFSCGFPDWAFGPYDLSDMFVFLDPPYPLGSRASRRRRYAHEMTDYDHDGLVDLLLAMPVDVMLCMNQCDFYARALSGWRMIEYTSQSRAGQVTERLYMNYEEPALLHDYGFLGVDRRGRERLRRRRSSWSEMLRSMPARERESLLTHLVGEFPDITLAYGRNLDVSARQA